MCGIRLPYIQNGITYLQRVLRLRSGEALRAVLETEVTLSLVRQLLQKLRAVHGDLQDLFFGFMEYLLPL